MDKQMHAGAANMAGVTNMIIQNSIPQSIQDSCVFDAAIVQAIVLIYLDQRRKRKARMIREIEEEEEEAQVAENEQKADDEEEYCSYSEEDEEMDEDEDYDYDAEYEDEEEEEEEVPRDDLLTMLKKRDAALEAAAVAAAAAQGSQPGQQQQIRQALTPQQQAAMQWLSPRKRALINKWRWTVANESTRAHLCQCTVQGIVGPQTPAAVAAVTAMRAARLAAATRAATAAAAVGRGDANLGVSGNPGVTASLPNTQYFANYSVGQYTVRTSRVGSSGRIEKPGRIMDGNAGKGMQTRAPGAVVATASETVPLQTDLTIAA